VGAIVDIDIWVEFRCFVRIFYKINIVRVIKSRRMRWAGHVARMAEGECVYRVLVGRSEGTRPLGRPRRRWEDNIKMVSWLRIEFSGGLLRTRRWTFGFTKESRIFL
jgi:hypothetical protein